MKITAVVTCYESVSTIGHTLMSLLGQTRKLDQIIVTDDGSSNETCEFVRGLLALMSELSEIESKFITHARTTPYRLNTIRNAGIREASGELVLLVDGDILVPRDFLLQHEEIHERVLKSGGRLFLSCVRKNIMHDGEIAEGRQTVWGHKLDKLLYESDWSQLDLEPEQTLSQSTFLKKDWESVGQFDADFDGHWGFDEVEFAHRLKKAGVKLTCHGLVYHIDEGAGAGSRNCLRNRELYRKKTLV